MAAAEAAACRRSVFLPAAAIAAAAAAAYGNSFGGPFVFDDLLAIVRNPTIRRLWPAWSLLRPPFNTSVSGRPLLNASFALNYAIGGLEVWSYHALNLAIHVAAGWLLFGIVRRTLLRGNAGTKADPAFFALAVALLWTLHPLQTEAVTYVVQRAESLMGLFYFLTLYAFIRGTEPGAEAARREGRGFDPWPGLSVLACLCGMATKEVMVSAPLLVFLYDRAFVAGSFREAWRRRGGWHLALASSWLPLAFLVFSTHGRGGTSGFGAGFSCTRYWLTQFPAVLHYLRLAVWPSGQAFDYAAQWIRPAWRAAPAAAACLVLAAATAAALWRRPKLGFLGLWFFAILAPTSLVPGNRQTMAEQRMYLALAPLAVLAALLLWAAAEAALSRKRPAAGSSPSRPRWVGLGLALPLAFVLGCATFRRNEVYRSELALWSDTVRSCPGNPYAHNNLGNLLEDRGADVAAAGQYRIALRLDPDEPEFHNGLGTALLGLGQISEALAQFKEALRLTDDGRQDPAYGAEVHSNCGVALFRDGDMPGALRELETAVRLNPNYAQAHFNYGNLLVSAGRCAEAAEQYRAALQLRPGWAAAHAGLAHALFQSGEEMQGMAEWEEANRLDPGTAEKN